MSEETTDFRDPNDGAFTKMELREGPELAYICEKIESSIVCQHDVVRNIRELIPDSASMPEEYGHCTANLKHDFLHSPALSAFSYSITAYLALNNMLAVANDSDLIERLISMDREQLKDWLLRIDRGGLLSEITE